MIQRYQHADMKDIWSDHHRFETFLCVELSVLKELSRAKLIPLTEKDVRAVAQSIQIDVKRIGEIEARTQHEILAFVEHVAEQCGVSGKWIHYGLTSSDVLDTAFSLQVKEGARVLKKEMLGVLQSLDELIKTHGKKLIMGHTHGVPAQPMMLEHLFSLWGVHLAEAFDGFMSAARRLCCVKLSGAVGNYPVITPEIEAAVAKDLDLPVVSIASQVVGRHLHAQLMSQLATVMSVIEKIALDIRHHHRDGQIREGFAKGQMGSSAMPHKQNPIACENFSGMARLMRAYAGAALENIALWMERDISHSSVERVIFPDAFHSGAYTLKRLAGVLSNLDVDEKRMRACIENTHEVYYSQMVNLKLLSQEKDKEKDRAAAYTAAQEASFEATKNNQSFLSLIQKKFPTLSWSDMSLQIWQKHSSVKAFREAHAYVEKRQI